MRIFTTLAVLATLVILAACEPVPPAETPTLPEQTDACGAKGYQGLIGQPNSVLKSMRFPIDTRVLGPDQPVTADFRPDRLNIEYGVSGLIEQVSCY